VSLFKSASVVSLFTLVSRVTGLLRELLMAHAFGASVLTDAFNVAFRIPNMFRRLFAEGAFSQAFVPVLAAERAKNGEEATQTFIDQVGTVLMWALIITCVIGVAAAPILVWMMASGLRQSPGGMEAAVLMTRFMFPYIGFMSLVAFASGILNTYKKFAVPAATPVLLNVCMILAAYFGAPWFTTLGIAPIYAMAAGVMLGGVLQLIVQVIALKKLGKWPRFSFSLREAFGFLKGDSTKKILTLMLPALLGVSVAQLSLLINTQIASHMVPGSVSWLSYADRLMEFPVAMLGVALGVVLVPQMSAAKASGDDAKYSAMLDWGLRLVIALAAPCAVALLIFAKPLVATLFQSGAFTTNDVDQTAIALAGYGAGLLGLVAIKVLAPAYFAGQDVKTPVKIAVVVLILTQLLNIVLVPKLAHAGLALSIGIGGLVNAAWLLIGLLKRGAYKPSPGWVPFLLQVTAGTALVAVFLAWAAQQWAWGNMAGQYFMRFGLMSSVIIGSVAIYFASTLAVGLRWKRFLKQ
jgi:putative peptidoglycan lipid II flippase